MKKILKSRIFVFVLGIIVTSAISVVAANLEARTISFQPDDENWEVENVEEAINDLYTSKNSKSIPTTMTFAYGTPSQSSTKNYEELNKKVFAGLIGTQKLVCITYNSKLSCFTNNNLQNEKTHLDNVFGTGCSGSTNYTCNNDEYSCIAYSSGDFVCIDKINKKRCDLLADNRLFCYDS